MKSYHDPRPVCAFPFRLSSPAYAKRIRHSNRAVGRKTITVTVRPVTDVKEAKRIAALAANRVLGRSVTDDHSTDAKVHPRLTEAVHPCSLRARFEVGPSQRKPNLYDELAAEFGTTREKIKKECYRFFYGDDSTAEPSDTFLANIRVHLLLNGYVRVGNHPKPAVRPAARPAADWMKAIREEVDGFLREHVNLGAIEPGVIVAFCLPPIVKAADLEVLKSKDMMLALQPPDGRVEVVRNAGAFAKEMEALYQKYENVLGYNAVLSIFDHANAGTNRR